MIGPQAVTARPAAAPTMDPRGWAELVGVSLLAFVAFGLATLGMFHHDRTHGYSTLAVTATAAVAAVAGAGAAVGTFLSRRRSGGRPVQRLGRQVWRTGLIPEAGPRRTAALLDLERREKGFHDRVPRLVATAAYTALAAVQLSASHDDPTVWADLIFMVAFVVIGVGDTLDRRHRPELRALIETLRSRPDDLARTD